VVFKSALKRKLYKHKATTTLVERGVAFTQWSWTRIDLFNFYLM